MGYGKGEAFDGAAYYDSDDTAEVLNHQEPEEALEYCLENAWERGKTAEQILSDVCPITIYAYQRKVVDKGFAAQVVDYWMDDFDETHWCEEYGNFEGFSAPWSSDQEKSLRKELADVLHKYIDKAHVWQCEQVAEAIFDADEVRKLMKDCLEEFDEDNA